MNGRVLLLAGAAVAALAAAFWAWSDEPRAPQPVTPGSTVTSPTPGPATAPPATATSTGDGTQPADGRTGVATDRTVLPKQTYEQGLRGVVLDGEGRPLPALLVYLVDSAANDPLALPLLQKQRDAFGPMASCETAADGTFAVGVPVAQDRVYELYVVSKQHATARFGGLRVLPGQWHELDAIRMSDGASLKGRVTVVGRADLPVPMATVTVEVGGAFADTALRALPEADLGLVATADQNGNWELHHVPSRGAVQVSAVAQGFARLQKTNIELSLDHAVEVNFALHPGTTIRGEVVDGTGSPIAGAGVEAWPLATGAGGPFPGRSDDAGRFEVPGLGPGKYRVRIAARGYERFEDANVAGDRGDLRCVLYEQSRVRVRVQTPTGEVVRSYQLGLRRIFPEQGNQIAAVNEVPEQRVRLDGLTDACEVGCVPIGVLAVQVEAPGWAKTLSEPFDNRRETGTPPGPRQFDLVVTMRRGASLRGQVLGEDGRPLAGATVVTQAADTVPDSPLMRLLAGAVPDKVTVTSAATGADGAFVLSRLAMADYQLMIEHKDACRQFVTGVRVERDGEIVLPPIRMLGGALVGGRVTVAGRVAGQVKVVLTTPATVLNPRDALRLETTTDPDGAYAFTRRVPPGDYDLRAAVVGTTEPEAQIFRQLLQLQRSSTKLSVAPGQRQADGNIDLPSDH